MKRDPRSSATDADLVAQTQLALKLRDRMTEADDAVKKIRSVKLQLEDRAPKMTNVKEFASLAKTFTDSLSSVEDSVYQTKNASGEDPLNFPVRLNNQIAALMGFVQSGDRKPPPQAYEVFNVLSPKLDTQLGRYDKSVKLYLDKINALLKAAGLQPNPGAPPTHFNFPFSTPTLHVFIKTVNGFLLVLSLARITPKLRCRSKRHRAA